MNESDYQWKMRRPFTEAKLPGAVREVVRLINEPKTSVASLAAAVAKHQTLAESVLRKANVSTYGVTGRVKSLNSAVVMLGMDVLKETSRGVLIASAGQKLKQDVILHQMLWEHSMGCAIAAYTLASRSGKCNAGDAFIAGLLHDVGALFPAGPSANSGIVRPMLEGMTRFVHAHVGADKVEEWGMAKDVAEAIRFHHLPRFATINVPLTGVVHLAEFVCHRLHIGAPPFEQADHVDEASLVRLGIPEFSAIEELVSHFGKPDVSSEPEVSWLASAARGMKGKFVETLDKLREEQRLLLALHYVESLSASEIGQLIETPAATVAAQLSDTMKQLRNTLLGTDLSGFVEKI